MAWGSSDNTYSGLRETAPTNTGPAATSTVTPTIQSTAPLTAEQSSAKATIQALLDSYGLGSLADWYWQKVLAGEPDAQIQLELRQSEPYKQRFAGMAALSAKGRAISESEYIDIERQYVQLFRQAGLPSGFYDQPSDFAGYIGNEVSPNEMAQRLDIARQAVYETPPEVRAELGRLYNTTTGDAMAYLLDPNKALPIIQQQYTAAAAGAASKLAGYGLLTRDEAERVALSGYKFDQLSAKFDQLAQSRELFAPLVGEQGQTFGTDQQLAAAFGGDMATARALQQRAQERVAAFQGGGSFAGSSRGVSGLGSAES